MNHESDSPNWPGVWHRTPLAGMGFDSARLSRAVARGELVRLRRNWFCLPNAPADVVRAVSAGGSLTCVSAARQYGLWVPPDVRLHVSFARNCGRMVSLARDSGVCVHWRRSDRMLRAAVEPMTAVLEHSVSCLPEEMAVVLMDSALNLHAQQLTLRQLQSSFSGLPGRFRSALAKTDPLSQSGIETLARVRLRALGIAVRTQVRYPNVGRVDLVVGDRLVLELDGRETHDTEEGFRADRERDLHLFDGDYLSLRLTYSHVMHRWPEVERILLTKIRQRAHMWPESRRFAHRRDSST